MARQAVICLALFVSFPFTVGCVASRVYGPGGGIAKLPLSSIEAAALPEILLQMKESARIQRGKITGLETRLVRFLPAPYWNVEEQKIDIAEISLIVLPRKGYGIERTWASGFGIGFTVSGAIMAATSKYDEDYSASLLMAPLAGATVGLVAMAIHALSDSEKETTYAFGSMSDEEKSFVILKLMGVNR